MATILRPTLNKVPGMPQAKENNHIRDLTKLSRVELLDLRERESKLLANKAKLNRLPDKGERIRKFYAKVEAELERRANVSEAAALFSQLNIAAKGEDMLNELEWSGHLNGGGNTDPTRDVLDSDDETDIDPLRIIARGGMHERHTKVLPPEPQLITADDLEEIKSFENDASDSGVSAESAVASSTSDETGSVIDADIVALDVAEKLPNLKPKLQQIIEKSNSKSSSIASDSRCSSPALQEIDQHVRYLVEKTEMLPSPLREKFKPYKTTVSNVHDPVKERARKQGKHWEVTAATPPPIQHSGTKMLTLLDSVEIQSNYLTKLKELQHKQAEERLAAKLQRMEDHKLTLPDSVILKRSVAFTAYRTPKNHIEGEERYSEHEEVHDPLDEEKATGGITYTVYE